MTLAADKLTKDNLEDPKANNPKGTYNMDSWDSQNDGSEFNFNPDYADTVNYGKFIKDWEMLIKSTIMIHSNNGSTWNEHLKKFKIITAPESRAPHKDLKLKSSVKICQKRILELNPGTYFKCTASAQYRAIYNPLEAKTVDEIALASDPTSKNMTLSQGKIFHHNGKRRLIWSKINTTNYDDYAAGGIEKFRKIWDDFWTNPDKVIETYLNYNSNGSKYDKDLKDKKLKYGRQELLEEVITSSSTVTRTIPAYTEY